MRGVMKRAIIVAASLMLLTVVVGCEEDVIVGERSQDADVQLADAETDDGSIDADPDGHYDAEALIDADEDQ